MARHLDQLGKDRLSKFIDSGLQRLPSDWQQYLPGARNEELCIFCQNRHEHCQIMVVSKDLLHYNSTMVDVFSCDDCFHFVKLKEAEVFDQEKRVNSTIYNSKNVEERIRLLIEDYKFRPDHVQYLQELVHNDMNIPSRARNCYFCNGPALENYRIIDVPVEDSIMLTGGQVRSCEDCWRILKMSLPEFSLTALRKNHKLTQEFCSCGTDYYITHRELADRNLLGTRSKHLCPHCTFAQLNSDTRTLEMVLGTTETLVEVEPVGDGYGIRRFIPLLCEFCKEEDIDVDLTVDALYSQTSIRDKRNQKVVCESCKVEGCGPIVVLRYSRFTWRIYTEAKNKFRVIVKSAAGKPYLDETRINANLSDLILNYREDVASCGATVLLDF